MRKDSIGPLLLAMTLLLGLPAGAVVAQAEEQDETASEIVTELVEPGVERVVDDGSGHRLQERHPDHPRDIDRVAVAPDGTVWIASTARDSDNEFLDGFQVWPVGKPGLYGTRDGVPRDISFLTFMPDGSLWVVGSGVATFDGETWSGVRAAHRVVTPDGTLWLLSPDGGLESWDGEDFRPHLAGRSLTGLTVDDAGTLWAFGYDTAATFDGEEWAVAYTPGHRFTSPDGATWQASGRGVERVLGDERNRYLKRLNVNGMALAPDGTVWVAVERASRDRGGLYRITTSRVEDDPDAEPGG